MITIRYCRWRKLGWVIGILAFPLGLFWLFRPDVGLWTHRLVLAATIFLYSSVGIAALLGILMRLGVVQLIYSDTDKQTLGYKMARFMAETERLQERGFSKRYYESYDVEPPPTSDKRDNTPTP